MSYAGATMVNAAISWASPLRLACSNLSLYWVVVGPAWTVPQMGGDAEY